MATRAEAYQIVSYLLSRNWAKAPSLTDRDIVAFCEQIEHHNTALLRAAAQSYAERATWFPTPGQLTGEVVFLLKQSGIIASWDRAWRYVLGCRKEALKLPDYLRPVPKFEKSPIPLKGIVETIGWEIILSEPNTYVMHRFQTLYDAEIEAALFRATSSATVQRALALFATELFTLNAGVEVIQLSEYIEGEYE